jgi:excisionase family DNA binding protein
VSETQGGVPRLFLSVPDAIEASGLSRSVLYEKLRTGEIPHVKIGARTLIPTDGLRTWAERLMREAEQVAV